MKEWLGALGHTSETINKLNIIHVSGTKGKGSTCSWAACFLQAHARRCQIPRRIGMLTSPPYATRTDHIQIDGLSLSHELVVQYINEIRDALPQLRRPVDFTLPIVERGPGPKQFEVILAFHAFIRAGVDATIIECYCGGEYDQTNFVESPVVVAIASIGLDHVRKLGPNMQDIAWHKTGIFKRGAVALTGLHGDAMCDSMIKQRAVETDCTLHIVDSIDDRLPQDNSKLQLHIQRVNASLALAVADAFIARRAGHDSAGRPRAINTSDINEAVEHWYTPGRFEVVVQDAATWYIDFAHNDMSVPIAAEWYARATQSDSCGDGSRDTTKPRRVLLYCLANNDRDQEALLQSFCKSLQPFECDFDDIVFTALPKHLPYQIRADRDLSLTDAAKEDDEVTAWRAEMDTLWTRMQSEWQRFMPASTAVFSRHVFLSDALKHVHRLHSDRKLQVFAIGCASLPGINAP